MISRKTFLQQLPALATGLAFRPRPLFTPAPTPHLKLSCNLYSFNRPLRDGNLSLEEVIDFCADLGFDAVDPTGYYLEGYPDPPPRHYLYALKKRAFLQGMMISGTGVRNDFTLSDPALRQKEIDHVKRWIEVAAHLDAPVLRVFTGRPQENSGDRGILFQRVIDALASCADYGAQHGVIVTLQNHHELCKTAEEVSRILQGVDHEWLRLNLDIGSLRMTPDPYAEIEGLIPFACTWQIKEEVYRQEKAEKTNLPRLVALIRQHGYRGYLPLETLGPGDPKVKLTQFKQQVDALLGRAG